MPLFFRGGDDIATGPLLFGVYEQELKDFIEHLAAHGFGDFLLDIGANIGLTSCQSGRAFGEIHMFEPNPNAARVLRINRDLALRGCKVVIHDYGLGAREETLRLHVPRHNWGGAFIRSAENSYSAQLLSSKDGLGDFDARNYDVVEVPMRPAREVLAELFGSLAARGKRRGVIKIDVEGYERFVIESIMATLPSDLACFIVFENWDPELDLQALAACRAPAAKVYALHQDKDRFPGAPRWLNSLLRAVRGGFETALQAVDGGHAVGTVVFELRP